MAALVAYRPAMGLIAWHWLILQGIAALALAFLVARRYGVLAGALLAWCSASALWAGFPIGWYRGLSPADLDALSALSSLSLLACLSVGGAAVILRRGWARDAATTLPWLALGNAAWVCFQAATSPQTEQGGWGAFLGNPSMNGMLLGALFPIAGSHRRTQTAAWILIPAAVVLSRSSMAFAALAVSAVTWAALSWRRWIERVTEEGFMIVAVLTVAVISLDLVFDPGILSTTGRMEIWKAAFHWLTEEGSWWIGRGTGTAPAWLIVVQRQHGGFGTTAFPFLHNDWLQLAFEQGIVGLLLALGLGFQAIARARKRPALAAALVAVLVTAGGNWPLRSAPFALVIFILMGLALEPERKPDV